jgi:hypothetical protein
MPGDDADMEVEETTEPAPLQATGDSGTDNGSMMEVGEKTSVRCQLTAAVNSLPTSY